MTFRRTPLEGPVWWSRRDFLCRSASLGLGLVLAPAFVLPTAASARERISVRRAAFTMGTLVRATAYGESRALCHHAIDRIFCEFRRIDKLMSVFDGASQISRIGREAGASLIEVDRGVLEVVRRAVQLNEISDGAFDPTVEPLMELWGFRSREPCRSLPTDREIAAALACVGCGHILLDEKTCAVGLARPGCRIDLGGIAVGYSLDRAAAILEEEGVEAALIDHSGDILAFGRPPGEDVWRIGIADPSNPDSVLTTLDVTGATVSTSASYRAAVEIEGLRAGHIIDPCAGRPAGAVLSATAVMARGVDADALSTAAFVTGAATPDSVIERAGGGELILIAARDEAIEVIHRRS